MRKVVLTGPESVGKSTLARQLAELFNGAFVSEFARDYVSGLNRHYTIEDVEQIAQRQVQQYHEALAYAANGKEFVFFDTFLIITKVWFEVVYKQCPIWLNEALRRCRIDLYLLCYPDLPWIADGVRENGDIRLELFEQYKSQLEFYGFRYEIICGAGEERLAQAKDKINNYINDSAKIPVRIEEDH